MADQYDYLVIGSGIAGLTFALTVADTGSVAVVTKREIEEAATSYAQGGIAAVVSEADSLESHMEDTLRSGAGLCNEDVVREVVRNGPSQVRRLLEWGVRFTRGEKWPFDLTKEGGHSHRRILHAGDFTGREIEEALLNALSLHRNVKVFENHIAVNLVTTCNLGLARKGPGRCPSTSSGRCPSTSSGRCPSTSSGRCVGAYVLDIEGRRIRAFGARTTVLATGGAGKVYLYTSNPDIASGDGIAMAYRAGARVANLEFVQFHPTCLYHPKAKSFLISETMRGEGARLTLISGRPFMKEYDERGDLATRDIVARAIDAELKRTGDDHVLLDARHLGADFLRKRFPSILSTCLEFGIDITREPIPVVPAAHYFCGGVACDIEGKTNVEGLLACGEAACTGLHGANRLASNSLLEAVVLSAKAAKAAMARMSERGRKLPKIPPWDPGGATDSDEEVVISQNWDEIRRTMWNYVGIVRSNKRLTRALHRIKLLRKEIDDYYWNFTVTSNLVELRNIALVASLIIHSALARKESRGLHYNIDYPRTNKRYLKDTVLKRTFRKKEKKKRTKSRSRITDHDNHSTFHSSVETPTTLLSLSSISSPRGTFGKVTL